MKSSLQELRDCLKNHQLKVTPQRLAVLEAIQELNSHPSAEDIFEWVHVRHPGVASGTIYNILESFVGSHILVKVKTDGGKMRYDSVTDTHHHLYCADSERIEDYFDPDLDKLIEDFFKNRDIPGFEITDVKLQINGKFKT